MNYKRLTVIAAVIAAAGLAPVATRAVAQAGEGEKSTLEQRVAAIETYLHMSAVEKHDSIIADAKTVDDLKAAIIKIDRDQDALDRKLHASDPAHAGSPAERTADEVADAKKEIENLRTMIRALDDRIHKLEQRTR